MKIEKKLCRKFKLCFLFSVHLFLAIVNGFPPCCWENTTYYILLGLLMWMKREEGWAWPRDIFS